MSSHTALRRVFFVVPLMACLSGGLALATQPDGGADLAFNATRLPGGGEAYSFPARPEEPAPPPDPSSRGLVVSRFGRAASVLPVGAGDDRENTEPTSWAVYEHQTASDILTMASNNNYRVVDLAVESATQFTATYVANTQTFAKTWWIIVNATPTDLFNFATTNNARIVSMKTLDDPAATVRFFAILISNTGADAKTWWFYQGQTTAQLTTLWQTNNARLTQVTSHVKSGTTLYDAVMIANTGADQKAWWWYVNATVPSLSTLLTNNNARLYDLDRDPTTGNYNAIMTSCGGGCTAWWWYVGVSTSNLIATVTGNGARLIDASVNAGCSDQCWSILMIDESHVTISGNAGAPGVTLTYNGGSTVSDGSGNYAFTVASGFSGTVTPSKPGLRFTPASRTYAGLGGSANGQDFAASPSHPASDIDGDGKTDVTVYRPSTGTWWTQRSSDGATVARAFGLATDVPVPGDYDGDGKGDLAIYRPSTGVWWIQRSSDNAVVARTFGISTDLPMPGDYDGDGKTDVAIYRPSTGTWWIQRSSDGAIVVRPFGNATDIPVPGDYDGDGKVDVAIFRPSTGVWWIQRSSDAAIVTVTWGTSTDKPAIGSHP